MNASDIVKAKQNKALYAAYYKPRVYSSTIYSTFQTVSSFLIPVIGGYSSVISNTSCINTVYNYVNNPTFVSYETLNQIKNGGYDCGASSASQSSGTPDTSIYGYSPVYSTVRGIISPMTPFITSSVITAPISPYIASVQFSQGCNQCITNTCTNCLVRL